MLNWWVFNFRTTALRVKTYKKILELIETVKSVITSDPSCKNGDVQFTRIF